MVASFYLSPDLKGCCRTVGATVDTKHQNDKYYDETHASIIYLFLLQSIHLLSLPYGLQIPLTNVLLLLMLPKYRKSLLLLLRGWHLLLKLIHLRSLLLYLHLIMLLILIWWLIRLFLRQLLILIRNCYVIFIV